ncbi:hypothetical protein C8J56DRAFT_898550 [Mycena floridula]|nr:hypothetical protein C8J56DRAFT_898550 [Mycena floridula]
MTRPLFHLSECFAFLCFIFTMSDDDEIQLLDDPVWGDCCLRPVQGGCSIFNNNKGIEVKVTFYALPDPQLQTRKNQKIIPKNRVTYLHEDFQISNFLLHCVTSVEGLELLNSSILYGSAHNKDENSFSLKYDICKTSYKEIEMWNSDDFNTMMDNIRSKNKPSIIVRIYEHEVILPGEPQQDNCDQPTDELEEQGEPSDDEEEHSHVRKRKKSNSDEDEAELELQDRLMQIKDANKCEDHHCENYLNWCIMPGPNTEHLPLHPKHFRMWSAAWVAEIPGVDDKNPPNNKIFDCTTTSGIEANRSSGRYESPCFGWQQNNMNLTSSTSTILELKS